MSKHRGNDDSWIAKAWLALFGIGLILYACSYGYKAYMGAHDPSKLVSGVCKNVKFETTRFVGYPERHPEDHVVRVKGIGETGGHAQPPMGRFGNEDFTPWREIKASVLFTEDGQERWQALQETKGLHARISWHTFFTWRLRERKEIEAEINAELDKLEEAYKIAKAHTAEHGNPCYHYTTYTGEGKWFASEAHAKEDL